MTKPVVCIMGPTAVGKTDLALALAAEFPVEIVSVDSAMVYQGMNIGTAKPSPDILREYPHHLIDILTPDEAYSAGRFVQDLSELIPAIHQRGKIPLLVGGTMLYFHALQSGLASLPEANETTRKAIEAEAKEVGWEQMHQKLTQIDPRAAAKIRPQDPQRICRALEVYELTGKTLSSLQKQHQVQLHYPWLNLILYPATRAWLHERIAERFQTMIQSGLIEEVAHLLTLYPHCKYSTAMRSVGYRQVVEYLEGKLDKESLIQKGIISTRQLAKRQCTWLKSWAQAHRFEPLDPDVYHQVKIRMKHVTAC